MDYYEELEKAAEEQWQTDFDELPSDREAEFKHFFKAGAAWQDQYIRERLAEVAPFCIVKMDDGSSINLHKGMLTPEVISELKSIAADQSVLNLVEDTSEENID